MKRLLFLLGALLFIAFGSLAVTSRSNSESDKTSVASADTDLRFVRKITVYQSDFRGGTRSFQMDLVKSVSNREYGLSSGPVGNFGYIDAWKISPNPAYRRTNEWYGRYTHYSKISGIDSYFNM
ncbi:MAG: hypothetical protein LUH46_03655 [Alistipes sp.]|nr:hypothetical protein [Alistipes sp.]